jgi:2-polyprenyl-3-methyl-5-hydroxy-6-metoxy-1,4-benzoquinol methylase
MLNMSRAYRNVITASVLMPTRSPSTTSNSQSASLDSSFSPSIPLIETSLPLSPPSPDKMDWSTHFPTFFQPPPAPGQGSVNLKGKKVEFADVGCGFGGLSIALAPLFPETLMLGAFYSLLAMWA